MTKAEKTVIEVLSDDSVAETECSDNDKRESGERSELDAQIPAILFPLSEPGAASSSASAPSSAASNAAAVVAFDLWPLPDVSLPHEVLVLLRQFLPTEHFANVHSACVYEQESWKRWSEM